MAKEKIKEDSNETIAALIRKNVEEKKEQEREEVALSIKEEGEITETELGPLVLGADEMNIGEVCSTLLPRKGYFCRGGRYGPGPATVLKFKTPEDLEAAIVKYFNRIGRLVYDKETGNAVGTKFISRPTLSGLAQAIGISTSTLKDYSKKEKYANIVIEARDLVLSYAENAMYDRNSATGAIFISKQLGWSDNVTMKIEPSDIYTQVRSPEEIEKMIHDDIVIDIPEEDIKVIEKEESL